MWLSAPPQRWKGSPTRSPRGLSLPWRCTPVRMVTVVGWMRRSSSSLMSPRCAIVLGGRHRKPRTARRAGTGRAAPSARRGLGQPRGARRRFRLLLPGGTVAVVGRRLLSQLDATPADATAAVRTQQERRDTGSRTRIGTSSWLPTTSATTRAALLASTVRGLQAACKPAGCRNAPAPARVAPRSPGGCSSHRRA